MSKKNWSNSHFYNLKTFAEWLFVVLTVTKKHHSTLSMIIKLSVVTSEFYRKKNSKLIFRLSFFAPLRSHTKVTLRSTQNKSQRKKNWKIVLVLVLVFVFVSFRSKLIICRKFNYENWIVSLFSDLNQFLLLKNNLSFYLFGTF